MNVVRERDGFSTNLCYLCSTYERAAHRRVSTPHWQVVRMIISTLINKIIDGEIARNL